MRSRWLVTWALALALILPARPARAVDLTSAGGFLFDVMEGSGGELSNGTIDAYDSCYSLRVDGSQYEAPSTGQLAGRLVRMPPTDLGGLEVSRTILVPDADGRDYARYIDSIRNGNTSAVTVEVRIEGNLGSDGATYVWGTASGDTVVVADDEWIGTDDSDGDGDPTLVHAFFGEGAPAQPTSISLSSDSLEVMFRVDVSPGETISLMFFAFQTPNQATARSQVEALRADLAAAVADLTAEEAERIVNWPVAGGSCSGATGLLVGADRVHCGSLRLAVSDVEERARRAVLIVEGVGGRVERQDGAHLVLRVPVPQFDQAFAQLEALGDVEVRHVVIHTGAQQARAIEVRLRSARDVRARLQQLLARSQTAAEGLAITREIERLDLLIEQLEATLRELEEHALWSTIDLRFRSTRPEPEPIPQALFVLPFPWLDELGLENLLRGL